MSGLDPTTPADTPVAFAAADGTWQTGTYTGRHEPQLNGFTAYEITLPDRTTWVVGATLITQQEMIVMAAKPDSRYNEDDHREAQRKLHASMRRVNRARARRAQAETPGERREWNRSVRADEHDAARALRAYLEAEAKRPVLMVD